MERASSSGLGSSESRLDYSFGFDNVNFSDKILLIEIIDDAVSEPHAADDNRPHWAARNVKRRHCDDDLLINAAAMRVKSIHISSLILAARSPFFHRLFSNGMRESEQQKITLRIKASEEASFMDLLNYVYGGNLPTTLFALLDLLVTSDKFEVDSCLRDCTRLLQNLPMTCESASFYLDLPSSILTSHTIQPLIDAARQFLIAHLKDVGRCKEEVLNLPLAGIRTVLSSDSLQVDSEWDVYDLVLAWARRHYPDLEERREILRTHLLDLIRFPLMTSARLMEVLTCSDIDHELASEIVTRALYFRSETPHQQRCLAAEKDNAVSRQFAERVYKFRPVKVIEFDLSCQQCVTVYLDLKWADMRRIFPDGHFCSENLHLGRHESYLIGRSCLDKNTNTHFFWLLLIIKVASSAAYTVNIELASRVKPLEEFVCIGRGSHTFTEGLGGIWYLFNSPLTSFLADGSPFFINGILHLRADLTIKK